MCLSFTPSTDSRRFKGQWCSKVVLDRLISPCAYPASGRYFFYNSCITVYHCNYYTVHIAHCYCVLWNKPFHGRHFDPSQQEKHSVNNMNIKCACTQRTQYAEEIYLIFEFTVEVLYCPTIQCTEVTVELLTTEENRVTRQEKDLGK